MMNETFHWNDRELLRYLGCKNGTAPDQNTADLIMQCKQELEAVASPRVTWREYPLSFQGHVIDMTCLQTQSKSLERNLRDCERVLLFAATLGSQVDVLLHRYNMIQMSKAVVMQAASVAMLDNISRGAGSRYFSVCIGLPGGRENIPAADTGSRPGRPG